MRRVFIPQFRMYVLIETKNAFREAKFARLRRIKKANSGYINPDVEP
jgi:hypothetical protein